MDYESENCYIVLARLLFEEGIMEITPTGTSATWQTPAQSPTQPKAAAAPNPDLSSSEDTVTISDAARSTINQINLYTKDLLQSASSEGKALLASLGKGVFSDTAGKPTDIGDSLVAIVRHYDKIFSDMGGNASSTFGSAQSYASDWDELNGIIGKYLQDNMDKSNQAASGIDLKAALERGKTATDTFFNAFSSANKDNGIEAALNAAREALAKQGNQT
jgi:hypothetical protein